MRRQTRYIVVHCSATRPGQDIGADEIDAMHTARKWKGIGYHSVVRLDGRIEFGRHFDETGAHVKSHNFQSVGVCLIGGLNNEGEPSYTFTDAQMASLASLVEMLTRAYPGAEVLGHRDLSPDLDGDGVIEKHEWLKACPCFDVREWARQEWLTT